MELQAASRRRRIAAIESFLIVYPPPVNRSKDVATELSRPAVLVLAALLYFAQGLPFGIVTELAPLYLRQRGASLSEIGLLSTISLAWTLKFLWSPLIDRFAMYRVWIRGALILCTVSLAGMAATQQSPLLFAWIFLTVLAFASATQDIAIDALTIVSVPPREFGLANATRLASYRVAIIVGGGAMAALSSYLGWSMSFAAAAAVTVALTLYTFILPRNEHRENSGNVRDALLRWLKRPELLPLLLLVVLYRLGDAALTPMVKPFWLDRGYSVAEIGTVTTIIGVTFTIVGAFIGGIVIERIGLVRSMLWLGLAQILSNVGYAVIAQFSAGRPAWYGVAIVESLCNGLGAAAFLSLLMSMASREHAATDFALLSALYRLAAAGIGTASGFSAQHLGYAAWFWVTVFLGIPGLALVWWKRSEMRALLPADGQG
jgi:PAT family beta-lactamase induction signal transducer AmpG